jgi:hypothetical protein
MPSESVNRINQMLRQGRRRYRLVSDEHRRGRVVPYIPGDDDEQRDSTNTDRPGAEARVRLPWVAVPRRD